MLPLLAQTPQSGDGAEQLMTALRGGVLHPPGFPLQAWLNRAVLALFSPDSPAHALSMISLIAHCGTIFLVAETLRLLGAGIIARLAGAAAYAFYPATWTLAELPEVFALAYFFSALILRLAIGLTRARAAAPGDSGFRGALCLGAVAGLAFSQHPIIVTSAPALLAALWLLPPRGSPMRWVAVIAAGFVAGLLYSTLPLLRTGAAWPDWGKLDTVEQVVRHLLRLDYGVFILALPLGQRMVSAISFLPAMLLRSWNLLLPLAGVGLYALLRDPAGGRARSWILGGSAAVGLAFLAWAEGPGTFDAPGVLQRFQGTFILPAAILLGVGLEFTLARAKPAPARAAFAVFLAAWAAFLIQDGWGEADAGSDQSLAILREGMGLLLPEEAVYFAHSDYETNAGAPTRHGTHFPIETGLLGQKWYVIDVLPLIDRRVHVDSPGGDLVPSLVKAAVEHGAMVAATREELLVGDARVLEMRGYLYVTGPGINARYSKETVEAAIRLCPLAAQLKTPPARGHFFSRGVTHLFARGYLGAAKYLSLSKAPAETTEAATRVAMALEDGQHPETWIAACASLEAAWKKLR